jgi:hypothetical protein
MNDAWGRKIRPVDGGSFLKGSGREGAQRGGRRVEAEWEREGGPGHDVEQRGGVASVWQRPGRSACRRRVAVRQWRVVGSASLTGGLGRDRGARSSAARCGARQRGEAAGTALTGGAGSTVCPIWFQTESILFQTDSNLPQTLTDKTSAFPCSKNSK